MWSSSDPMSLPLLSLHARGAPKSVTDAIVDRHNQAMIGVEIEQLEKAKSLLDALDETDELNTSSDDEDDDELGDSLFLNKQEGDEFDACDFSVFASYEELLDLAARLEGAKEKIDSTLHQMEGSSRFADDVLVLTNMRLSIDAQHRLVKKMIAKLVKSPCKPRSSSLTPTAPRAMQPMMDGELRELNRELLVIEEANTVGSGMNRRAITRLSMLMSVLAVIVYQLWQWQAPQTAPQGQEPGGFAPEMGMPQLGEPAMRDQLLKTKRFVRRQLKVAAA